VDLDKHAISRQAAATYLQVGRPRRHGHIVDVFSGRHPLDDLGELRKGNGYQCRAPKRIHTDPNEILEARVDQGNEAISPDHQQSDS
jgi:hypothetical protein